MSTDGTSSYLDALPAIFREDAAGGRPDFLGRLLLAFERVLTGLGDPAHPGIEEILDGIVDPVTGEILLAGAERYFAPGPGQPPSERAPEEFLAWLAGWVALTLREDWTDEQRRRILAEIVPSYQRRGTREGLRQVLSAYTGLPVESIKISEFEHPFIVGKTSIVGGDTALGGGPPHYFLVETLLAPSRAGGLERERQVLRAIIDAEKPAHTYYDFHIQVPTMQINVHSTVGLDTLLGGEF